MPKNSLKGVARLFLFPMLLLNLKSFPRDELNLSMNIFSALNPFTTFKPPKVSSKMEI